MQLRYPAVVTWRDRLIERITVYSDIAEARAKAGTPTMRQVRWACGEPHSEYTQRLCGKD